MNISRAGKAVISAAIGACLAGMLYQNRPYRTIDLPPELSDVELGSLEEEVEYMSRHGDSSLRQAIEDGGALYFSSSACPPCRKSEKQVLFWYALRYGWFMPIVRIKDTNEKCARHISREVGNGGTPELLLTKDRQVFYQHKGWQPDKQKRREKYHRLCQATHDFLHQKKIGK
ncbi:hypothetical protein GF351_04855 [Candidatus Woesearchaeota archaeon]|nr:hypothetical protein [Candidatus Woesearchaeota archaeon]